MCQCEPAGNVSKNPRKSFSFLLPCDLKSGTPRAPYESTKKTSREEKTIITPIPHHDFPFILVESVGLVRWNHSTCSNTRGNLAMVERFLGAEFEEHQFLEFRNPKTQCWDRPPRSLEDQDASYQKPPHLHCYFTHIISSCINSKKIMGQNPRDHVITQSQSKPCDMINKLPVVSWFIIGSSFATPTNQKHLPVAASREFVASSHPGEDHPLPNSPQYLMLRFFQAPWPMVIFYPLRQWVCSHLV